MGGNDFPSGRVCQGDLRGRKNGGNYDFLQCHIINKTFVVRLRLGYLWFSEILNGEFPLGRVDIQN